MLLLLMTSVTLDRYEVMFMQLTFKHDVDGNLWFMWCSESEVRSQPQEESRYVRSKQPSTKFCTKVRTPVIAVGFISQV
jgi:nicotinamide riboside transporter PnuC